MNEFSIKTLKNGLRLILVPKNSTEVVTVLTLFKVGSRNEKEANAGISHVLEHMHYKGTKKRPTALEVSEFIEAVGGEHNAFTGKEYTGYYVKLVPKNLERAFDFLSDNLLNNTFNPSELEKEKGVIIEEINMYEDLPMIAIENKFETAIFGDNALGRDIIGTKKTVSAVSSEDLTKYKAKHYGAENSVVVLAGNFGSYSEKDIENLVLKYFKYAKGEKATLDKIDLNKKKILKVVKKKTEQSHFILGFRTVEFLHKDFFALDILATILGGSMSSRMFEEVREKRGLAYSVKSCCSNYSESGVILTRAGVPHTKAYEAIEAVANEYKKIKKTGATEAELAKAKEIVCSKILIRFEDSEELAHHYAEEAILADKVMTPEKLIENYRKVTLSDILRVAQEYLVDERLCFTCISPEIEKDEVAKILQ